MTMGMVVDTLVVTEKNGNEFEITLHGETIESLQIKELE